MILIILILFIAIFAFIGKRTECVGDIEQHRQPQFNSKDDYEIIGDAFGLSKSRDIRIFGINFGNTSDQQLYNDAYRTAVGMKYKIDGLLNERYEYKETTLPFVIFTIINKEVRIIGKAYHIK